MTAADKRAARIESLRARIATAARARRRKQTAKLINQLNDLIMTQLRAEIRQDKGARV